MSDPTYDRKAISANPMAKIFDKPPHASQHCRYYSYNMDPEGGKPPGPCCAKNVDLRAPGSARVCMPSSLAVGTCTERQEYTTEERAAWAAWQSERFSRMLLIMEKIPGRTAIRTTNCFQLIQ
jgi:hypothetical protein